MLRKILCFVCLTAAVVAVPLKNENFRDQTHQNAMTFIGSVQNKMPGGSISESRYYKSVDGASWSMAKSDCIANIGKNATLLYIETQEELLNVTRFLDDDSMAATYWVGGWYDVTEEDFFWDNNIPVGPWAPWAKGEPDFPVGVTRLGMRFVNRKIEFVTYPATTTLRYICELKSQSAVPDPEPCFKDNDLAIIIDSSGSIGQPNYNTALEFAAKLAVTWADHWGNRLSVSIFSSSVESVINLSQNLTTSQLRDTIYGAKYLSGSTGSAQALDRGLAEFTTYPRQVTKNIVFLTDGASDSAAATIAAAQRVQNAQIRSFAVGITNNVNANELLAIAGNKPEHVFNTDGFDDLLKLLQPVSRQVCE